MKPLWVKLFNLTSDNILHSIQPESYKNDGRSLLMILGSIYSKV